MAPGNGHASVRSGFPTQCTPAHLPVAQSFFTPPLLTCLWTCPLIVLIRVLAWVPHQARGLSVSIQTSSVGHPLTGNELLVQGTRWALLLSPSGASSEVPTQQFILPGDLSPGLPLPALLPACVLSGTLHSVRDVLKPASPSSDDETPRSPQAGRGTKTSERSTAAPPSCSNYRAAPQCGDLSRGEHVHDIISATRGCEHSFMLSFSFWLRRSP